MPVYRWMLPEDIGPVDRLLDAVYARAVDAVTFTSAPAAASLLERAERRGRLDELLDAFRGDVLVGVRRAGDRAAAPVAGRADPAAGAVPARAAGAAARPRAARRGSGNLPVAGHRLEMRGHAAVVDGALRPVPPAGMALLRALARRPGWVVGRGELLRALPGAGRDEHAVETAMARLRAALGAPKLVQTVVKRGYRLALDPRADAKYGSPPLRSHAAGPLHAEGARNRSAV